MAYREEIRNPDSVKIIFNPDKLTVREYIELIHLRTNNTQYYLSKNRAVIEWFDPMSVGKADTIVYLFKAFLREHKHLKSVLSLYITDWRLGRLVEYEIYTPAGTKEGEEQDE